MSDLELGFVLGIIVIVGPQAYLKIRHLQRQVEFLAGHKGKEKSKGLLDRLMFWKDA